MATENPIVPAPAKKAPAKSKPRTPSLHPPYFEMIKEAIVTLKERTGSSQYAITKFIEENQKNLPANFKKVLLTQLKKFVAAGKLVKVKASYKLPATAAPAKKKPVAKPKTAVKPKPVKKIAPAKKKTVAKPKPKAAAKPKTVAKAKVAKMSTPSKKVPAAKKVAAKKAGVKSLKPKAAIAKKATGSKGTKK
ncbi:hypothetical protein M8C21_001535 [Ambrosia artemisiifolia]|uniref:H15 domain-containing protein n=1 Tax=Ambrosia artemisiifolia TaxID=4212 RepID=A0AAD5DBF8_AMBAR|nr:hypothetical protein M8C21_001535 [Ambrosia artemisiifolia]